MAPVVSSRTYRPAVRVGVSLTGGDAGGVAETAGDAFSPAEHETATRSTAPASHRILIVVRERAKDTRREDVRA
jgi:hypothetical protein